MVTTNASSRAEKPDPLAAQGTGVRRGLAALHAGQPGHLAVDERLERQDVQMLPAACHRVMHRLVGRTARWTCQTGGLARDLEVDRPLVGTERHVAHRRWRTQPKACVKSCSWIRQGWPHQRLDSTPDAMGPVDIVDFAAWMMGAGP